MNETYTFSRALHLMRYGGKKMRSEFWGKIHGYLFVNKMDKLEVSSLPKEYIALCDYEIMGSWIEVKE